MFLLFYHRRGVDAQQRLADLIKFPRWVHIGESFRVIAFAEALFFVYSTANFEVAPPLVRDKQKAGIAPGLFPSHSPHAVLPV